MDARVIEVLQQAVSQDPNILKSAEQTLKQWETQQGFYIALYVSFVLLKVRFIMVIGFITMFFMYVLYLYGTQHGSI